MTELQQRTLQVAKRYLGVYEDQGSNRGKVIAQFQLFIGRWVLGQPWCAAFASFCLFTAAKELGVTPEFEKTASSSAIYRWAKRTGNLLPKPTDGCIGLVIGGPTGHEHTCLVHTVEGDTVLSVDGNISNRVRWVRRSTASMHYVRII